MSANEQQVGGNHYKKLVIQPWDYITANDIPYLEGCAIKYLTRWRDKGGVADLEKARHFIDKLIENENNKEPTNSNTLNLNSLGEITSSVSSIPGIYSLNQCEEFICNNPSESEINNMSKRLREYIKINHASNIDAFFKTYASSPIPPSTDWLLDTQGVVHILQDVGLFNAITRRFWASRIIDHIDKNKDGKISLQEFKDAWITQMYPSYSTSASTPH